MFISRDRNGTYYTRITLPKTLRDVGFPFSIRSSLATKCRQTAIDKNLSLAAFIRQAIANLPTNTTPNNFSMWINTQIAQFKSHANNKGTLICEQTDTHDVRPTTLNAKDDHSIRYSCITEAFNAFIITKQAEAISGRSIAQLRLRVLNHIND